MANYKKIDEIEKAAYRLERAGKSFGCDNLLNEYVIESFDTVTSYMLQICNAVINVGHFPTNQAKGLIVSVFINNRLNNWIKNENILSDARFGFRKAVRLLTQYLYLMLLFKMSSILTDA